MPEPTVLILDDDAAFARAAGQLAYAEGYRVQLAHSLQEARKFLAHHRTDLLLLDLNLPDGSGLDLLDDLDLTSHGQVAIVTGSPSIESAIRAVASPIAEYLLKPLCPRQLESLLRRTAQRHWSSRAEHASNAIDQIVGNSPPIRGVVDTVLRIASSDASVLLSGESGTGKELVARAIHEASGRPGRFVAVNCGAVHGDLAANQLFGEGTGVFEQAAHGTLFLDEITEMPQRLQVHLLRVIESGCASHPGQGETPAPVRIVSASNADVAECMAKGTLRQDLYYRLADLHVGLPPLRERGEDVVLLANLFIRRLNTHYHQSKRLASGADLELLRHGWPGNVRELRSAVQRAFLLQRSDLLHIEPIGIRPSVEQAPPRSTIAFSVGTPLAELERRAVAATLAHYDNDKAAAAQALGVSVRTIYNHLSRMAAAEDAPPRGAVRAAS